MSEPGGLDQTDATQQIIAEPVKSAQLTVRDIIEATWDLRIPVSPTVEEAFRTGWGACQGERGSRDDR